MFFGVCCDKVESPFWDVAEVEKVKAKALEDADSLRKARKEGNFLLLPFLVAVNLTSLVNNLGQSALDFTPSI